MYAAVTVLHATHGATSVASVLPSVLVTGAVVGGAYAYHTVKQQREWYHNTFDAAVSSFPFQERERDQHKHKHMHNHRHRHRHTYYVLPIRRQWHHRIIMIWQFTPPQ